MENYQKIKRIGRGTFGSVVLVKNIDEQLFAMKRVPIDLEASQKEGKQINNEINVLKTLNHPSVVKYHDSFIEKDYICIVMDYAENGDLQRKIKEARESKKPFP